jgi:hypothetical protein
VALAVCAALSANRVDAQDAQGTQGVKVMGTAESTSQPCEADAPVESGRRSPSVPTLRYNPTPCNPNALSEARIEEMKQWEGLPDRWRIVEAIGYRENLWDPYNGNNWLKGDKPAWGEDWFVSLLGISDSIVEPRRFRLPVSPASSDQPGTNDTFTQDSDQLVVQQNFALEAVVFKGNTVFKPPDYEFRVTPVVGITYVDVNERGILKANPDFGTDRTEAVVGLQSAFVDKHLRNVSDRYDFDSLRVGIQPFQSDFRGFLFQDAPVGIRLFGTRANNRYQYNIGVFRRIEKDTNTGLNNVIELGEDAFREDDFAVFNFYAQDLPVLGFTSQATVVYNRNREGDDLMYDDNGIIQRPSSIGLERGNNYDVTYVGLNGDGHWGRTNLTLSVYGAFGDADRGTFVEQKQDIQAAFVAGEASWDFSWIRVRTSAAFATADEDPFDDKAEGFDSIFENPLFIGADTNFWTREPVPLIGGGRVTISGRNGMLNNMRSSKEFGQSNFNNPGLAMAGVGADFDISPTLRLSPNLNYLRFVDSTTVELARTQAPIDEEVGVDASLSLIWRPMAIQNVVVRLSGAALIPGDGGKALFGDDVMYAVLGNLVMQY